MLKGTMHGSLQYTTMIQDMHNDGMSIEEIAHALNEPARLAYEEGTVDSPILYDEEFVERAIG